MVPEKAGGAGPASRRRPGNEGPGGGAPPAPARRRTSGGEDNHNVAVIFDGDPFFRAFQAFLLAQRGFHVLAPEEPESFSVDYLAKARPRLLVTEILLPGTEGLEIVRGLRQHPALQKARVVVFSVLHVEARALASGADRFVHKPLMRDGFLEVIDEMKRGMADEPREAQA